MPITLSYAMSFTLRCSAAIPIALLLLTLFPQLALHCVPPCPCYPFTLTSTCLSCRPALNSAPCPVLILTPDPCPVPVCADLASSISLLCHLRPTLHLITVPIHASEIRNTSSLKAPGDILLISTVGCCGTASCYRASAYRQPGALCVGGQDQRSVGGSRVDGRFKLEMGGKGLCI